jgi:hypothetical protein
MKLIVLTVTFSGKLPDAEAEAAADTIDVKLREADRTIARELSTNLGYAITVSITE